jgi:6-hydroxytryprostatin B O-methyltransferase
MGALSDHRILSVEHVINGYDWAALGEAVVVDVGGGVGHVSKALAIVFPSLNFVVQDRLEVIGQAVVEDDIRDRVSFTAHDVFDTQPVEGADVYFIRRVLMEKSEEECVAILKALQPALKRGAIVLVQDPMLPEPGACSVWVERRLRDSDALALALVGSETRESEDWERIIQSAGGYKYKGVSMRAGTNTAFVEAVWTGP